MRVGKAIAEITIGCAEVGAACFSIYRPSGNRVRSCDTPVVRGDWTGSSVYESGTRRFREASVDFATSHKLLIKALREMGPVRQVAGPMPVPFSYFSWKDYEGVALPKFGDDDLFFWAFCIGTCFLGFCLYRLLLDQFTKKHHVGFEAAA